MLHKESCKLQNGMIFAKLQDEQYDEEYKAVIRTVLQEYHLQHLPVLYNLNFGHIEPKFILPYSALAEINCEAKTFSILESGVVSDIRMERNDEECT